MTIDPQKFGELKSTTEACKTGIEEIKNLFGDHLKNYREDIRDLHVKADKAHSRVDDAEKEFAGFKGKILGFTAAIGALWTLILKWITGED